MTIGREKLTIVEIDMDYCQQTFGNGGCTAALSSTVPHKCHNTYATCPVQRQFGKPVEPDTPDHEYEQGDTITNSGFARGADVFWAIDLTFPGSDADGCIVELGGAATGLYVGVTSDELVIRAGNGAAVDTETAYVAVDVDDYLGTTGALYVNIDWSADSIEAWFYDKTTRELTAIGSDTASAGYPTAWAGSEDGGVGKVTTLAPVGESTATFNGSIYGVRVYDSTSHTPVEPDNTLTLRFAENQGGLPKGQTIFPALQSVSTRAGELNLSGIDPSKTALGKRARVECSFLDFAYHDTYTDKYALERRSGAAQNSAVGYLPEEQGTFFGKHLARSPYYVGRSLRVKNGYVGDDLSSMDTSHYVMTQWEGPSPDGTVKVTAKDILDLADNEKAVCPSPSPGKLSENMSETDLTLTLEPEGAGTSYSSSGRVCIGREVMTYTRSGDVLTITDRAVDGTEVSTHEAGDTVQECFYVSKRRPHLVVRDLLRDYAGVDGDFIPLSEWAAEVDQWISGTVFTTTITKPTGVAQLIGEICQHGFLIWWDELEQEIRFRTNRPLSPDETIYALSDSNSLIRNSVSVSRAEDQRISALYFYHGVIDPTSDVNKGDNFAKITIALNTESSGRDKNNQESIKTIYSRWFGATGDDAVVSTLTERLVSRYAETPKIIEGEVDAKDRDGVPLGGLVSVTSRQVQDAVGVAEATQMQVNYSEAKGDRHRFKAETYDIAGRFGFWMQDVAPTYTTATASEKASGAFWGDDAQETMSDGTSEYIWY